MSLYIQCSRRVPSIIRLLKITIYNYKRYFNQKTVLIFENLKNPVDVVVSSK